MMRSDSGKGMTRSRSFTSSSDGSRSGFQSTGSSGNSRADAFRRARNSTFSSSDRDREKGRDKGRDTKTSMGGGGFHDRNKGGERRGMDSGMSRGQGMAGRDQGQ
ncbi:hypothetical protein KIPB_013116, partial [Kipferlia bialata]|eukprot:g13116.t1